MAGPAEAAPATKRRVRGPPKHEKRARFVELPGHPSRCSGGRAARELLPDCSKAPTATAGGSATDGGGTALWEAWREGGARLLQAARL